MRPGRHDSPGHGEQEENHMKNWPKKKKAAAGVGVGFVGLLIIIGSCSSSPDQAANQPVSAAASAAASAAKATPAPSRTTAPKAAAKATASSAPAKASVPSNVSMALAELAALSTVTPHLGYERDLFGSGFKSGVRDEVIADQYTGTDPYTGSSLSRGDIQIDHVVALGNAWATGAYAWTSTQREAFANDENELLAVSAHANESKGDDDASQWLPTESYQVMYVEHQIGIKAAYHLGVTADERVAMKTVLNGGIVFTADTPDDDVTAAPAASVPARATAPATAQDTGNYHAYNGHPCSWVEDNTNWGHSFQTDAGNKWDRDGDGLACES